MSKQEIAIEKAISQVGEAIPHDLGFEMIQKYYTANPTDNSQVIGKNIILEILAQPGCEGIRFFHAYNEEGEKTLVYMGIDATGKAIVEYNMVSSTGEITKKPAIVADRTSKVEWVKDLWDWIWGNNSEESNP